MKNASKNPKLGLKSICNKVYNNVDSSCTL